MSATALWSSQSSRSQSMSPITWVALACVGGLGLFESIKDPPLSPTLESVISGESVIVRLPERSFDFPVLAVRVNLPDGWTYLSTTNPALASKPTFVNESANLIVTLTSAHEVQNAAIDVPTEREEFDSCTVDWIQASGPEQTVIVRVNGIAIPLRWRAYDHHRIGLLNHEGCAVILNVISPEDAREETIRQFCRGIQHVNVDLRTDS